MKNEPSPISTENINENSIVYDIVYQPMNTDLIKKSKENGATIIYGYEMLLSQAACSFEIWHKTEAPYDVMKKALLGGVLMTVVKATIHGAISIVNAIATGKGAALGISKTVNVEMETSHGNGIVIEIQNKPMKSRLISRVIQKIVPKSELSKTKLRISLDTEIPAGYGLKSSSAISTAVAMASAKLFKPQMNDIEILSAGVGASIETKVSLTGAYDDACACYYGGFVVTDNYKKKLVHSEKCLNRVSAVIFIPKIKKKR